MRESNMEVIAGNRASLLKMIDLTIDKKIEGRIRLQKTVYLIQQLAFAKSGTTKLEYKFDLYLYGTYSKSLAMDVTYISNRTSFIQENENGHSWVYSVDIDKIRDNYPSSIELFGLDEDVVAQKVNELVKLDIKPLECISTIVFLVNDIKEYNYSTDVGSAEYEKLKAKVKELKPHVMDVFDESMKVAKEYVIQK